MRLLLFAFLLLHSGCGLLLTGTGTLLYTEYEKSQKLNEKPEITTIELPQGVKDKFYNFMLTADKGHPPYQYSELSGNLPAGLILQSDYGIIIGNPQEEGLFNLQIRVNDSQGYSTVKDFILEIHPKINVTGIDDKQVFINSDISETLNITGGIEPYTVEDTDNTLSSLGLTLSDNEITGIITGTIGTYDILLKVTDSGTGNLSQETYINVKYEVLPEMQENSTFPGAIQGQDYAHELNITGGQGPYTAEIIAGDITEIGLSLEKLKIAGKIKYDKYGQYDFTVRISDSLGNAMDKLFSIVIDVPVRYDSNITMTNAGSIEIVKVVQDGSFIYLAGNYTGSVDFGQPFGSTESKTSNGDYDIFITKIDLNHNYQWTKVFGSAETDKITDLKHDNGYLYFTGFYNENINFAFDFGGIDNKTSNIYNDGFICKIGTLGTYEWCSVITSDITNIDLTSMEIIGNSIYFAGIFTKTIDIASDWGQSNILTNQGGQDIFLLKIGVDNTYIDTWHIGSAGNEKISKIIKDKYDNLYLYGGFYNTVDFGLPWSSSDIRTGSGSALYTIFLTRINSGDTYSWTKIFISGANIINEDMQTYNDDIYISGYFSSICNFASDFNKLDKKIANSGDGFVCKVGIDATYKYVKTFPGNSHLYCKKILVNSQGVYIAGEFLAYSNFANDFNDVDEKIGNGLKDIFLTKMTHDGQYCYTRYIASVNQDYLKSLNYINNKIYVGINLVQQINITEDFNEAMSVWVNGSNDCLLIVLTE